MPQVAERSAGNPLFAEEMVNRIREEGSQDVQTLPETVHAVLAARLDSLSAPERRVLQHASVVGQTFWEGSLAGIEDEEGIDLAGRAGRAPGEGPRGAERRQPAGGRARVRVQARADPRRRLLDAAEVGAGAEARPGRAASSRSGPPTAPRAWWRWSPTTTAGPPRSAPTPTSSRPSSSASTTRPCRRSRRPATPPPRCTRTRRRSATTRPRSRCAGELDPATAAPRIAEKLGDVALRLGRVDQATEVWEQCLDFHRREEDLARVGDLHRKIGAGLWHKGDREGSIEHYQKGIDLLKDGPPCLELVRLYEEAASLYMHTGDNMLAIYASEKALRLAERLGEAAAASRAHGIFGRVFGRIGDSERARQNLERSVELARESDPGRGGSRPAHARLSPRGLRGRLRGRRRRLPGGARARRADRRPALARSSCTRRSPSSPPTAATGRRWSERPRPPASSPSARA